MNDDKSILDTNIVSYFMKGGPMAQMYEPLSKGNYCASVLSQSVSFISAPKRLTGVRRRGENSKQHYGISL